MRFLTTLAVAAIAAAGCSSQPDPGPCGDAAEVLGFTPCVHHIGSRSIWDEVAVSSVAVDQLTLTKYLMPARANARLPTTFINVNHFDTHVDMLAGTFGELFPGITLAEYSWFVVSAENREFYSGRVTEYLRPNDAPIYGFIVWDDQAGADTAITCEQFREVYEELSKHVFVRPLAAIPNTRFQRDVLDGCDVPSFDPSANLEYEVYTQSFGFGTVRRYASGELGPATQAAEFGWQDILVLEEAPFDVETIVSGAVTGTRQGELSHLNVRSASRGTPNCYVNEAYGRLSEWEGKLVRLECGAVDLQIREATEAEAETWWAQQRPDPVTVPVVDTNWVQFEDLLDAPTSTSQERATALSRYGAKGTNLAVLYQRIPANFQLEGFLIPFHYYELFMTTNSWSVDMGAGPEQLTFAETIDRYTADETFNTDAAVRRKRLEALRDAIHLATCDPQLMTRLGLRIEEVFGADDVMVRFRSSSNAEDALNFNGAGLYRSTSVCAADDGDADAVGPSLCDADKTNERGICRGLTRVWGSLWKPQAYDERSWYGIDQGAVSMAILVNTRSKNEQANIVAFSGDPTGASIGRFLVNAQLGEFDVVSAAPGMWPEKVLLTVVNALVTHLDRVRESSEVQPGQVVLTDEQLGTLGNGLWNFVQVYPVDTAVPTGHNVLLDTEWKVLSDGRLIIKQVRPFLQ